MANTVIGVYDDYSQAQKATDELLKSGFSQSEVRLSPAQNSPEARQAALRASERTDDQSDQGWSIGNFFSSLFGTDDSRDHADLYSEAVRRGSYLLTVDADSDSEEDRAADIMDKYDPVDIDERASYWKTQGWSRYDESAPAYSDTDIERERGIYASLRSQNTQGTTGKEVRIPVVEEQLKVGKREVQRGGVRVFRRMTEKPVHESVQLREEHVNVERRPVNQPATEADMAAFKDESIEVRESAEEAVVGKTARVVEEVVVGKEVSQRTETIDDTVRRTEVEVEQLGAKGGANTDDSVFRNHWQSTYGHLGGKYEDYAPAYQYGRTLASDERYKGYRWNDIEPEARRDWESKNSGPWGGFDKAVRHGWEKRNA
jgi:uncharacterized protein (TIGR02271 family)